MMLPAKNTKRRWKSLAEANVLLAYRRARRARWAFHYLPGKQRAAFLRDLEPSFLAERERVLSLERESLALDGLVLLEDIYIERTHEHLDSLERFARFRRKEVMLGRNEVRYRDYDTFSRWVGYVDTTKPRADLYFAYMQLRAFHYAVKEAPAYFERLCELRSVPASRRHAVEATRLVKLVLGEPGYLAVPHSGGRLVWIWDERLVSKVASVIALADHDNVNAAEMPTWIKAQGGLQACLARFREIEVA